MKDGLPSDFVYRVIQDQEGYIWVCTNNGVAKYDGYQFKVYNASNGLKNSDVWNLEIDSENRIWVTSFDDLAYIQNDSIFKIKKPVNFEGKGIYQHVFIDDHHLVLYNNNKSEYLEIVKDTLLVHKRHEANHFFKYNDEDDFIIGRLSDDRSVYKISTIKDQNLQSEKILRKMKTGSKNVYTTQIGNNYIVMDVDSTFVLNENIVKTYSNQEYLGINHVQNIRKANDNIFIESEGNILLRDLSFREIKQHQFLTKKLINSFYQDDENNYWVSSSEGLQYYLTGKHDNTIYSIPDPADNFKSIIYTPEKEILLSTKKGNLYRFETNNNPQFLYYSGLPGLNTLIFNTKSKMTFALDGSRGVYRATLNKEVQLNNKKFIDLHLGPDNIKYAALNYFKCNPKDFAFANKDDFAIAHSYGVSLFRDGIIQNVMNERSYALCFLKNDLWVGTTKGIQVYDDNLNISKSLLDSFFIKEIVKEDDENIWIVTDGAGLLKYNNNELQQVKGTKDLTINKIIIDDENNIWLACINGLLKLSKSENLYKIESFHESDGIAAKNIIDIFIHQGKVYLLSPNDLTVIDKEQQAYEKNTSFVFEGLFANGEQQAETKLHHTLNNIEIFFKTKSYTDLQNLTYEWNLTGLNEDWRNTSSTSVSFNLLPPGNYTFNIRTRDAKGALLNEDNKLSFCIKSPWYQTWLFYALAALATFGSISFFSRRRIALEQRKAEEKSKVQKQFYELEMKAIQAQMNPHFIFNALNSIQNYIYNKEPEIANDYLVDFSKLMRLILESTNKEYVKIENEIELIKLYVSLERMRFQNKFNFNIMHDPIREIGDYTIPSNVIQPFVENAINHGIANKKEASNLTIQFYAENDIFQCVIEDDGIGRERAKKFKKQKHVSRAMSILKQRQELMALTHQPKIDFKIIDLYDESGSANGTKVIINIPLETS